MMLRTWQRIAFRAVVLVALLLSACHRHVPVPEATPDRAAPNWIRLRPEDSSHFVGIGYAPQSFDPAADQTVAIQAARQDLLQSIRLGLERTLASSPPASTLWPRVAWTDFEKVLEQLPIKDQFVEEHRRRVWVLIELDRKNLDQILAKRKTVLEPKARKHLESAQSAATAGNIELALRQSMAALSRLSGPEGLLIKGNKARFLRQDAEDQLSSLLQQLEVEKVSGPQLVRSSALGDARLSVRVESKEGDPISGLPLSFLFITGSGEIVPQGLTASNGSLEAQIRNVDPRVSPVEIQASLNLQALLTAERLQPLPEEVLEPIAMPRATWTIHIEPPRLLLAHIERGGTGGSRSATTVNELADALRQQGLSVQEASVKVLVNPEAFRKVEQGADPGKVEGADLVGVVSISLNEIRKQKGKYQEVYYGRGEAVFRLYDLQRHRLMVDLRMPQEVSGFSQGDVERNFFLQSIDELRTRVMDTLDQEPLMQRQGS